MLVWPGDGCCLLKNAGVSARTPGLALPLRTACGILVPRPGIEPMPPAVEAQSLNHWTTREVPGSPLYYQGGTSVRKVHQRTL